MNRHLLLKGILIVLLSALVAGTIYLAYGLHKLTAKDKEFKADYFTVNQIKYGLLSGDNWSGQINSIIVARIDSFTFSGEDKKILTFQINNILNRMMDEVDKMLHTKQDKLADRLRFGILRGLVDTEKLRKEIPEFTKAIILELDKPGNRDQLKAMLKEKTANLLHNLNQDTTGETQKLLKKYGTPWKYDFNKLIQEETARISKEQDKLVYAVVALVVLMSLMWLILWKKRQLHVIMFVYSVVFAFVLLYMGVCLPMIEIDARIEKLDLELLGSHVEFRDQIIYYRSKSIIEVIGILMKDKAVASVAVGSLVLLFSVIFPSFKLISAVYLLVSGGDKRRLQYIVFNSGKWSMADVFAIAIFMAFIGFRNIVGNQLDDIDINSDTVNLVTTNGTSLQTGFVIFTAFCLYNLLLAGVLSRIIKTRRSLSQ